jgi:hypothetical protein
MPLAAGTCLGAYEIVAPIGGRFLAIRLAEDASPATAIRVALDWTSELSRLMKSP